MGDEHSEEAIDVSMSSESEAGEASEVESWADLTEAAELEELQTKIAEHIVRVRHQISYNEFHAWKTYLETTPVAGYLRRLLNSTG